MGQTSSSDDPSGSLSARSSFTEDSTGSLSDSVDVSHLGMIPSSSAASEEDEGEEDTPYVKYINRPASDDLHQGLVGLGMTTAQTSAADLRAEWFHPKCTRKYAYQLLRNAETGSFLVRPSSQRRAYALSWVKGGQIHNNIIYELNPGFSLRKTPEPHQMYSSLSSLVAHCPFLTKPVAPGSDEESRKALGQARINFLTRMLHAIHQNERSCVSLEWRLHLLESFDTGGDREKCEHRTFIRYGEKELVTPELFSLTVANANLLGEALALRNHTIKRLVLVGHKGMLRSAFTPLLTDDSFKSVCVALNRNCTISELIVHTNAISDEGAKALSEVLCVNRSLRIVDISRNFIGIEGVTALASTLHRRNHWLNKLLLAGQLMGDPPMPAQDMAVTLAISAIESGLSRKREIFSTLENGLHLIHGFMTRRYAEKKFKERTDLRPGKFLFYLNPHVPDAVQVCLYTAKRTVGHRTLYRVYGGYSEERQCVPNLQRHACWAVFARMLVTPAMLEALPIELHDQVTQGAGVFPLWRVDDLENPIAVHEDVFQTLTFYMAANRAVLSDPVYREAARK